WFNPEVSMNSRLERNPYRERDILTEIAGFLYSRNPHNQKYLTAHERIREASEQSRAVQVKLNARMEVVVQEGADLRRENLPVGSEVAAIIPDVLNNDHFRDIILAERHAEY